MIAMLREIVDFVMYVVGQAPSLKPIGFGLVASWAITQGAKTVYRDWSPFTIADVWRQRITRSIAFWSGFIATWLLWYVEAEGKARMYGGFAAVIVGVASPVAYVLLTRFIGTRWPKTREWLSGDRT